MNWLKKGPELKLPKLGRPGSKGGAGDGPRFKPPAFLADLYYDLRDRRLLLPIALVVLAIAAVPILLGSADPVEPPPVSLEGEGEGATASASLAVVEAKPGLRDYRKRFGSRSATDPFKQRYTSLPPSARLEETGPGPTASSSGTSSAVTAEAEGGGEAVEPAPSGGSAQGGGDSGGGTAGSEPPPLIEFVFDVQVSRTETTADGKQKMGEPEVRRKVRVLTQLPGEKTPVVTVGGLNLHNGKVIFLVSDDVQSLEGDFTCLARTPSGLCELLEIEPGFPLELVYGSNDVRYRIKVTKIDTVPAGHVGDERQLRGTLSGPVAAPLPTP